jgi:hypothetical protein
MKLRIQALGVAALLLDGGFSAGAQGALTFANRVVGVIDAPVTYLGDVRPGAPLGGAALAAGPNFLAQLAIVIPGVLDPHLTPPQPFRTGSAAGYVSATAVTVPGVPGGTVVQVTMLAWAAELGASYAEAVAKGLGMVGTSANLQIMLVEPPGVPADLVGLQPFSLAAIIPEPSAGLLALAGAGTLLLCRRR